MKLCKTHKECFEKICILCEDYAPLSSHAVLAEVRADIQELLKSIDEYHETFSVSELESFSRQKLDAGVKMMRLKNKVSEHFS